MNARPSRYPLCRHTKTNGRICQSPAVHASAFCHFHQKLRRPRTSTAGPGFSTNVLHPLRNAQSLQEAFAMVFSGLATDHIHPKKAGKMLFALDLASRSLRKPLMNQDFSPNRNRLKSLAIPDGANPHKPKHFSPR